VKRNCDNISSTDSYLKFWIISVEFMIFLLELPIPTVTAGRLVEYGEQSPLHLLLLSKLSEWRP
jgi:hypothetical protein